MLVDDAHRIVFSGDIMVNIKGFSKEQYDFNLLAPYLMTTVNLDSRRAAAERKYLQSLFPTDVYTSLLRSRRHYGPERVTKKLQKERRSSDQRSFLLPRKITLPWFLLFLLRVHRHG